MFTRNTNEIIKTEQTKKCNKSCRVEVGDWMRVASFCFTCFSQIVCLNEWEEEKKWEDRVSEWEWMYWKIKWTWILFGRMKVKKEIEEKICKKKDDDVRKMREFYYLINSYKWKNEDHC